MVKMIYVKAAVFSIDEALGCTYVADCAYNG